VKTDEHKAHLPILMWPTLRSGLLTAPHLIRCSHVEMNRTLSKCVETMQGAVMLETSLIIFRQIHSKEKIHSNKMVGLVTLNLEQRW